MSCQGNAPEKEHPEKPEVVGIDDHVEGREATDNDDVDQKMDKEPPHRRLARLERLVEIGTERREATKVVNIMDALKKIRVLNPIQVNGHWVPSLWGYDATQGGDTASHEDVTVED